MAKLSRCHGGGCGTGQDKLGQVDRLGYGIGSGGGTGWDRSGQVYR